MKGIRVLFPSVYLFICDWTVTSEFAYSSAYFTYVWQVRKRDGVVTKRDIRSAARDAGRWGGPLELDCCVFTLYCNTTKYCYQYCYFYLLLLVGAAAVFALTPGHAWPVQKLLWLLQVAGAVVVCC